ncbi:MAG: ABC transporter ATP-binding protein [Thermotogaceae bacterium]|nr:ABC transporter ATP-binding protein [Thermotogaceae bacterium]
MIELVNVTKVYAGSVKAVDDVSLTIEPGQIFGFLGPNGAGKTTTIKMMVGLLRPTKGSIKVNGYDVIKDSTKAKASIGYVADEPLVMEKLTGAEYLKFVADVFRVSEELRRKRIPRLLDHFKLKDAVNDLVASYSHGMRQKLSLIAALLHNPSVWILDEPIVGLDPESAYILKQMMRTHADSGNIVFFSTHVMEIAEKICDRIGIISKGRLRFVGTVSELREARGQGTLEELFLEVTGSGTEKIDFSYLDLD